PPLPARSFPTRRSSDLCIQTLFPVEDEFIPFLKHLQRFVKAFIFGYVSSHSIPPVIPCSEYSSRNHRNSFMKMKSNDSGLFKLRSEEHTSELQSRFDIE